MAHDRYQSVQIPKALFMDLVRWHLGDIRDTELEDRIQSGLQRKLEAMAARENYPFKNRS